MPTRNVGILRKSGRRAFKVTFKVTDTISDNYVFGWPSSPDPTPAPAPLPGGWLQRALGGSQTLCARLGRHLGRGRCSLGGSERRCARLVAKKFFVSETFKVTAILGIASIAYDFHDRLS